MGGGLKALLLMVGRNLTKTMDYLEVFARFKDEENIKAVERLLNSHTELEMFERSQLGMCPSDSTVGSTQDVNT